MSEQVKKSIELYKQNLRCFDNSEVVIQGDANSSKQNTLFISVRVKDELCTNDPSKDPFCMTSYAD